MYSRVANGWSLRLTEFNGELEVSIGQGHDFESIFLDPEVLRDLLNELFPEKANPFNV